MNKFVCIATLCLLNFCCIVIHADEEKVGNPQIFNNRISYPVKIAIGMGTGDQKSYGVRTKSVHQIKNISGEEADMIFAYFDKKIEDEPELRPIEIAAIKNDLVRAFMQEKAYIPELFQKLCRMYRDNSNDIIWRDYCIQFIGQLYSDIDSKSLKEEGRLTLEAAFASKSNIAGTALIAMSRLTDEEGFNKERLSDAALRLSKDSESSDIVKTTALQVGANLGNKDIIPIAKEVLDKSKDVPLKVSAIAALGLLKDQSSMSLIEKYASSNDVRLRAAAQAAIKRLSTQ